LVTLPDDALDEIPGSGNLELMAAVVARLRVDLSSSLNLLGDALVEPARPGHWVHEVYNETPAGVRKRDLLVQCFRAVAGSSDEGWVEVLPFNDNLTFLKGAGGTYDVVVRETRDGDRQGRTPFDELPLDDLPSALRAEAGFATEFFDLRGQWEERLRHESQEHYYRNGGRPIPHYPGNDEVLAMYLRDRGVIGVAEPVTGEALPGFRLVVFENGRRLFVQESPMSVGQRQAFLAESSWSGRRRGQRLEIDGGEAPDLPAASTFVDAQACCGFYEAEYGRRFRLVTWEEWLQIAPKVAGAVWGVDCLQWSAPDQPPADYRGEPVEPQGVRFGSGLKWLMNAHGLRFVAARDVFEWTQDRRIVSAGEPSDVFYAQDPRQWGWHKGIKTCFRLCYEA
jgi:hypothetical protein